MKHTYNIIFMLCCLFFVPVVAGASEKTRYSALVNKVSRWSSRRVMQLASQYSRQGKDGEAIVLYSIVSDRYRDDMTEQEKHECILAHLKTDSIYFWRGSYSDALEEAVTGVKIGEQCNVPKYVARLYCDIGSIYGVFLDYEKSVNYYLKAEDLCRKYPDRATEHDILVNLTGMYTFLGKNAEARKYRRKAERLKTPGDPVDEFMSGYTLSLIQATSINTFRRSNV